MNILEIGDAGSIRILDGEGNVGINGYAKGNSKGHILVYGSVFVTTKNGTHKISKK